MSTGIGECARLPATMCPCLVLGHVRVRAHERDVTIAIGLLEVLLGRTQLRRAIGGRTVSPGESLRKGMSRESQSSEVGKPGI